MFDLLIRGGTIVDGTGRARYRGDFAIEAGRVAAIERGDALITARPGWRSTPRPDRRAGIH